MEVCDYQVMMGARRQQRLKQHGSLGGQPDAGFLAVRPAVATACSATSSHSEGHSQH